MNIPSLLRVEEHAAMHDITLSGKVIDLGGGKRSHYRTLVKGDFECTTVNIDKGSEPDIFHDLETPLPPTLGTYDGVLLINVLEHIFNYKQLLRGCSSLLNKGGKFVVIVPFLFPVHPSPQDFRRFTAQALEAELHEAGFTEVVIKPLGKGVLSACFLLVDRLLPTPLRLISMYSVRYVVVFLDGVLARLARATGKKYDPAHYPIGYIVTALK